MTLNPDTGSPTASVVSFEALDTHSRGGSTEVVTPERRGPFARASDAAHRIKPLFWFVVIIPTLLATLYFGFLAQDVFISESRFVVRSPDKPQRGGLGVLLGGAGFSSASEEVLAAQGFIDSRDGLKALNADGFARRAWGDDDVSILSRFNPLGWYGSFEDLYSFYRGKVHAEYNPETSITTLTVRAFSPRDAQAMNTRLLQRAEALVNELNERGSEDLVKYAEREVAEARQQASEATLALASYRNRAGVIDPERQATVQLQMISKLQDELIGARMQLLQLSAAAARNPQIPLLRLRVTGLEREIEKQLGQIAGNENSLSEAAAEFQRLQLQQEFANQQLALALSAQQEARNEARRQRAYVERVAQPSLPDDAREPRRLRGIFATFIVALLAWAIMTMLLAGIREHKA